MEALEILVVILSTLLAVFLVLGIVLLTQILFVMRKIRDITERVDKLTNSFGSSIIKGIRNNLDMSAMFGAMISAARKVYKKREQRKDDKEGDDL